LRQFGGTLLDSKLQLIAGPSHLFLDLLALGYILHGPNYSDGPASSLSHILVGEVKHVVEERLAFVSIFTVRHVGVVPERYLAFVKDKLHPKLNEPYFTIGSNYAVFQRNRFTSECFYGRLFDVCRIVGMNPSEVVCERAPKLLPAHAKDAKDLV
jgi:hypothetical protein